MDEKILHSNMATVVVSSCDKYEEAWAPFFFLFRKYWPECKFDVVLNTETKKCDENNVLTINAPGQWCARLEAVLERINTPYIIIFLEDFFFLDKVDSNEVDRCIDLMNKDSSIASFYFKNINCNKSKEKYYDRYYELMPIEGNGMYVLNLQAGVWRKSVLQDILNKMRDKSPWDLEVNGFEECREIIEKNKFYCNSGVYSYEIDHYDVFPYVGFSKDGIGIRKSKVLWNTKKFLKREGIDVDFRELKTMSYLEFTYYEDIKPFMFRAKQFVIRRINRLINKQ